MTPELAKTTIQFLQRAQMTGAEVPAYIEVVQALTEIAKNLPPPTDPVVPPVTVKRGRKPKAQPAAPPASA